MSCVLEVHELWKSYAVGVRGCSARIRVLRGVSLRLAHGEQVGILGAPGAGKTTLLHCIAGLRLPDAGLVRVVDDVAVRIRLLDEGLMERDPSRQSSPAATLRFARELGALRGRVDRVLVLHDGRLLPLDSLAHAPVRTRRVAEPGGARHIIGVDVG